MLNAACDRGSPVRSRCRVRASMGYDANASALRRARDVPLHARQVQLDLPSTLQPRAAGVGVAQSAARARRSRRTPAARRSASSLITCSTSAVAVCCSSASLVSLNRRAFWIAITAWSAKVLQQRELLVAERAAAAGGRRRSRRCRGLPTSSARRRPKSWSDRVRRRSRTAGCAASASRTCRRLCTVRRSRIAWPVIVLAERLRETSRAMRVERRAAPRAPAWTVAVVAAPGRSPSCSVANRRWQLSRIFSNTGAVSATELLMTCSTSAVAVCCSSASFVSLNRRTFSIAITAWRAKVCSSATSLSA